MNKLDSIMKEDVILLNIARIQSDSVVADLKLLLATFFSSYFS